MEYGKTREFVLNLYCKACGQNWNERGCNDNDITTKVPQNRCFLVVKI